SGTERLDPARPGWRVAVGAACWLLLTATSAVGVAPDDELLAQQWNLEQIGAADAWARSTGTGVNIGVVDSGIDADHPDLAGKIVALADCTGGPCREGGAPDGDGHGTSVAGVAAAATGNGLGIAGVAPDAQLVVAKVLDDDGTGEIEDISSGIRWVVDHGARVVSLSLGDPAAVFSRAGNSLEPAIQYAWSRGAIPVLAAGNYNPGVLGTISAGYGNLNAVVVGATDRTGRVAFYSTPLGNAKWGIVAPGGNGQGVGEDILSPDPGDGYGWHAGTSLAVPHVSGALALLLAQGLGQQEAVGRLLDTLDTSQPCGDGCRGRLRADAAVNVTGAIGPAPTTTPAAPESDGGGGSAAPVAITGIGLLVGAVVATVLLVRRRR
ncbi:MAG TPA: S8 family serine peptidase, partial [Acidimicrobiales bacterium]